MSLNVLEHYFVARRQSRVLLRNGSARLWWTAHLSRDEARKDPYELTGVLLSSFDITQQALERNWRRSHVVLHAFLEFLMKHKAILLAGGNKNRAQIRCLAKFLNWHGGVCLLDFLGKNEIVVLLEGEFLRIYSRWKVNDQTGRSDGHFAERQSMPRQQGGQASLPRNFLWP